MICDSTEGACLSSIVHFHNTGACFLQLKTESLESSAINDT